MLERLSLRDVGPADEMQLELAPRLNVVTGDNGRVDLRWLERESPFVARELRRCGLLLAEDAD